MKLRNRTCLLSCAVVLCVLGTATLSVADDNSITGREIAAKYGPAVVKVQIVMKMSMSFMGSGESQEQKIEVTGTTVDPSGLTIVSMSSTNPADMVQDMYGGEMEDMHFKTDVTDVKIRLADGKEVPAKIVLRDKDLDLAFLRPANKPATPLPYLDIKDNCKLDVLDQTITVTRLGKIANRTVSASINRIQATVDKPRKFYTVGLSGSSGSNILGSPVFSMDGKVVGIVLLRVMQGLSRSMMSDSPIIPVIIPAEDIAPIAAQAPEDAPKPAVAPATKTPAKTPKAPVKTPSAPPAKKPAK